MAKEDDQTVISVFNFNNEELVVEEIPLEKFEEIIDQSREGYGLNAKILGRFETGETII